MRGLGAARVHQESVGGKTAKTEEADRRPWNRRARNRPPTDRGSGGSADQAAAPAVDQPTAGGDNEKFIASLPAELAVPLSAYLEAQMVAAAPPPKKLSENQVQAERAPNKANRQLSAAQKRKDEAKEAMQKLQAELQEAEADVVTKQAAVDEAAARLKELCAAKLSTNDHVIVPSPVCLANPQYKARFEALRAMEASLLEEEATGRSSC